MHYSLLIRINFIGDLLMSDIVCKCCVYFMMPIMRYLIQFQGQIVVPNCLVLHRSKFLGM